MSKVCILTSVHSPFDVRIFYKEATTLVKEGYEVVLIAQNENDQIVNDVRIVAVPKPKNRFLRLVTTNWIILRKALKEKADIYHLQDPELIPVGVIIKLIKRKKIIYDAHEDYKGQILYKSYLPKIIKIVIANLVNIVEKPFSYLFDAVVTATDDISNKFFFHNSVVTVKNFPIAEDFQYSRNNNFKDNDIRLVYIGGLTKTRGIAEIVQALEYIDININVKLSLYGKTFSKYFKEEVTNLDKIGRLEYKGFINFKEISDTLYQSDIGLVCLHPVQNYYNALPVKLFEYMASGIPVIASNFPLWKEIVEGNKCGITVDPLNPKEIAKAIENLIKHPDVRLEMGKNGRQAVEEKYNWENESKKLISLYQRLLNR